MFTKLLTCNGSFTLNVVLNVLDVYLVLYIILYCVAQSGSRLPLLCMVHMSPLVVDPTQFYNMLVYCHNWSRKLFFKRLLVENAVLNEGNKLLGHLISHKIPLLYYMYVQCTNEMTCQPKCKMYNCYILRFKMWPRS